MVLDSVNTHVAYRCPDCGTVIYGFVGKFALKANMLRLKCSCGNSVMDIKITNDNKVRLSVPCLFCRQNHSYVVSESLFFDKEKFLLNCPYSGMDIAFIGDEETISGELSRTEQELTRLMAAFEAEELADIQPEDVNEDEVLPDPSVYDTLRFVVKDLEAEGRVKCPCGDGKYDLRFIDGGLQVWCESCGATYDFSATSPTMAEEYLDINEITLK